MAETSVDTVRRAELIFRSYLGYKSFRYLKVLIGGTLIAIVVYAAFDPVGGRNGGTWVGYGLGGVATGLILWLTWFGVRRQAMPPRPSGCPT